MEPHREPAVRPGMGERHAGDGAAPGPRVAPAAGPGDGRPPLERLLAAAMRGRVEDRAAETQAVAAFRAARDSGAHTARTRRRDDWRPGEERRPNRSLRAAFAVLLAGLTLGGVAFAAIGPITHDTTGHRDAAVPRPSGSTADRLPGPVPSAVPGASAPGTPAPAGPVGRPPRARDTEAHCRAYASVRGRGKALDSRAWQRLVTAAGGEDKVEAFCAAQLAADAGAKNTKGPGKATDAGKPDKSRNGR
ncbi:hypothetical protein ACFYXJ_24735 [Streptomyces sp. NPDC002667]|uniref:hypothetical protein n=1 Tax=Streptomyces sp. NPDC002667 TaxID=3364657 RepID=UPI0036B2C33C